MTIRALLLKETEKARQFEYRGAKVWIPRSVCKSVVKFEPGADGRVPCEVDVADWFVEKNLRKAGTPDLL